MARFPTPGVYEDTPIAPPPEAVRDDICAFVGLATRGPVDVPVRLERWEEFRACFGERLGAALLPDAVLGFFVNGGKSCYVVRALHRSPNLVLAETAADAAAAALAKCESLKLGGTAPFWTAAQRGIPDPGSWANELSCNLRYATFEQRVSWNPAPVGTVVVSALDLEAGSEAGRLRPGALLWVVGSNPARTAAVARVETVGTLFDPLAFTETGPNLRVVLSSPIAISAKERVAVVEADLEVLAAPQPSSPTSMSAPSPSAIVSREEHVNLGFDPLHPRYLPRVLAAESRLVMLFDALGAAPIDTLVPRPVTDAKTGAVRILDETSLLDGGRDGFDKVVRQDFFDENPDEENPETMRGLAQLRRLRDVSLVVMPDLVLPGTPPKESPPLAMPRGSTHKRTRFVCEKDVPITVTPAEPEALPFPAALVDPLVAPGTAADRKALWLDLARFEDELIRYCEDAGDRVALLASPPSADPVRAVLWRKRFDSPFAAAYYPWLDFGDPIAQPPVRSVPPTGVAAGIVARSERRMGVGRAPANLPAVAVAGTSRPLSADDWALLHEASIDVFRDPPGAFEIRLLGARTLSHDRDFRYLHARRLLTHVERVIERRMGWLTFEPNTASLWSRITFDVDAHVLRPLFERGAFAGSTPETSYFVRCDETLNPPSESSVGRLWCEIGIAPNVPAEYIVFRLAATRDEGVLVREGA